MFTVRRTVYASKFNKGSLLATPIYLVEEKKTGTVTIHYTCYIHTYTFRHLKLFIYTL